MKSIEYPFIAINFGSTQTFSSSRVSTFIWLYHLHFNEMHEKKSRLEQHKNASCYFEQILEAAPHKTAAVRSLTSNLTIHSSKMIKKFSALLVNKELISRVLQYMDTSVLAN